MRRSGGQHASLAVLVLTVAGAACTQPKVRNFFSSGASFDRTFGQLFDDAGTKKASHYAVLTLTPTEARAASTGTVEYLRNFDGMGNCALLRPKKYLTTPNDFSKLSGLPKPGALILAFCNLDESTVQSAAEALYTAKLSPAEASGAATHFLNHDEGFSRLDVEAHETNPTQSTLLGSGVGGKLYVAALTERDDGTRTYVNPAPYLAGAVNPATLVDAVAPSLDEVVLETSASGTFGADRVTFTASGGVISGTVARGPMRVALRATERTTAGGELVVPYRIRYELDLLTLSGSTVVTRALASKGVIALNQMSLDDAAALGAAAYGATTPIVSNPSSGPYWLFLPWQSDPNAEDPLNLLDPAAARSIDLFAAPGGTPAFPTGTYELSVTVEDAVSAATPAATRTLRFTLGSGGAPPGDSELTYSPVTGPVGSVIAWTAVTPTAFAADTTVDFTGIFDPDGLDLGGNQLQPTAPFTVSYPAAKLSIVDAQHLTLRIGDVLPPVAVLGSSNLRLGHGGRLFGSVRIQTASTGFNHTTANVGFTLVGSVRFGQVVGGELQEPDAIPIVHVTSAADVTNSADFQRLVAEWRVPAPASPPTTVTVHVKTVDSTGADLDDQTHTLGFVAFSGGMAIYRSAEGGGRKLVLVDDGAFSGQQGPDLLAVEAEPGGAIRLDGTPPP